jgi:NADH dehydrogenase (ubiquinone) Fe-S protein 4
MGTGKDLHVPKNLQEMAVLSGMPGDHASRTVVIAPRFLKSVQSGQRHAYQWQLAWKTTERWSNPLMGWTSTADPLSNHRVCFNLVLRRVFF